MLTKNSKRIRLEVARWSKMLVEVMEIQALETLKIPVEAQMCPMEMLVEVRKLVKEVELGWRPQDQTTLL